MTDVKQASNFTASATATPAPSRAIDYAPKAVREASTDYGSISDVLDLTAEVLRDTARKLDEASEKLLRAKAVLQRTVGGEK